MAAKQKQKKKAVKEEKPSPPSCVLYGVSPPRIADIGAFADTLEAALAAGLGVFQLRLKEASDDEIRAATARLLPLCHAHRIPFILNDRPRIAADMGCDGVHLGQEDLESMPLARARGIVGEQAVIGITAHASSHLAMEAGEAGADYVAFGAFFATTSKPQEKIEKWGVPDLSIIEQWTAFSTVPCVAIGGVTQENCVPLVAAGADFIAAITSIWNHPQGAGAAVQAFQKKIEEGLAQRRALISA